MKKYGKIVSFFGANFIGLLMGEIMEYFTLKHMICIGAILLLWYIMCKLLDSSAKVKETYAKFVELFFYVLDGGLFWERKICTVPGFYGRENIIKELYKYHMSAIERRCILLCGYGGSGKSTIAKNFAKTLNCKTKIKIYDKEQFNRLQQESISSNTIIFCDYALEGINEIISLYNDIQNTNKRRVTLVLIERSETKQYCINKGICFDETFDLNVDKYELKKDILSRIISYNVKNDYDEFKNYYEPSGCIITKKEAAHLADLVIDRFDSVYKRPIFCVILAEIYKRNPNVKFASRDAISELFREYWDIITRTKRVKMFLQEVANDANFNTNETELIEEISREIRSKMRALIAVSSLLSVELEINITSDKVNINILKENERVEEIYGDLKRCIDKYLSSGKVKLYNYLLIEFGCNDFCKNNRVISPKYDLVSNWLFVESINNPKEREFIDQVFEILNRYRDLVHDAFSYSIRAADEMFEPLLVYFADSVINYKTYDENDYWRDIRLCVNQMLCAEYQNERGYVACKVVLYKLLGTMQEANLGEGENYVLNNLDSILKTIGNCKTSNDIYAFWNEEKEELGRKKDK